MIDDVSEKQTTSFVTSIKHTTTTKCFDKTNKAETFGCCSMLFCRKCIKLKREFVYKCPGCRTSIDITVLEFLKILCSVNVDTYMS